MRPAIALRLHRLLMRAALAAANLFGWIFVFEFSYLTTGILALALARTALLYALAQVVAALLVPVSARSLSNGMRREMVFGVISCATAFVFLGSLFQGILGQYYGLGLALFAICLGFYRALYWIPYGIEHEQTKNTSRFAHEILIALIPALAGTLLILKGSSETLLLFITAFFIVISLLPLAVVPETYERFHMTYRDAFSALVARAHRRIAWSAFIDGVQGAAFLLFWPIAVFLFTGWSYLAVGMIFSITCLVLILVRVLLSYFPRRQTFVHSPSVRVAIVSSAWIGRLAVGNPLSAIVADSYLHVGDSKNSLDQFAFEQPADAGHYIDDYTVIREIGLALGRMALCVVVVALLGLFPLPIVFGAAFVLAGISAGLSVLLSRSALKTI